MKKIFKKIDRFSIPPKLFLKGADSFPTIYGGFMSIAVFCLVIMATVNFSQNLLYKTNPNIVTSHNSFQEIPKFSLEKFELGFFLNTLTLGKFIDPTIFSLSGGVGRLRLSDEGEQSYEFFPLKMEKCTFDRFKSSRTNAEIKRLRFDLNICFLEDDVNRMSIEGGWGQKIMDTIYIDFNMCVNTTENRNSCKPKEYIEAIISQSFLGFDIIDSLIDLNDFEFPVKPHVYTFYTMSSSKIYREAIINIKSGKIKTDKGWLIEELEEIPYLKYDSEKELTKTTEEQGNTGQFARISFRMSNTEEIYQRKYDKIQDVTANIGAIMQLLFQISGILLVPLVTIEYQKAFSNRFYTFDIPELMNHMITSKQDKKVVNLQLEEREAIFAHTSKFKKLNIDFKESLKYIVSLFSKKKNPKFEYLKKSYDKVVNRLDVFFILEKIFEFEKLKMLLLNEDQIRLFEYLPKPKISFNKSVDLSSKSVATPRNLDFFLLWEEIFEKIQDKKQKREKAKKAFTNLRMKTHLEELDEKLITFLKARVLEDNKTFLVFSGSPSPSRIGKSSEELEVINQDSY